MKTRPHAKGISLMELVVVVGMFFAALGLVAYLFSQTSFINKVAQERNQIDGNRVTLLSSIRRHLADSEASGNTGFYLNDDPDSLVLSIISARTKDGKKRWNEAKQRPEFQAYQVFYRDASTKTIKAHRIAKAHPSTVAEPLGKTDLITALQGQPGTIVAQVVHTFQLCSSQDFKWSSAICSPIVLKWEQDSDQGASLLTQFSYSITIP